MCGALFKYMRRPNRSYKSNNIYAVCYQNTLRISICVEFFFAIFHNVFYSLLFFFRSLSLADDNCFNIQCSFCDILKNLFSRRMIRFLRCIRGELSVSILVPFCNCRKTKWNQVNDKCETSQTARRLRHVLWIRKREKPCVQSSSKESKQKWIIWKNERKKQHTKNIDWIQLMDACRENAKNNWNAFFFSNKKKQKNGKKTIDIVQIGGSKGNQFSHLIVATKHRKKNDAKIEKCKSIETNKMFDAIDMTSKSRANGK